MGKDRVLLGLTLVILVLEIAVLCHSMKWIRLPISTDRITDGRAIGLLTQQVGSVRVRTAGNLTWYPLGQNDPVQMYDTVFTTASASGSVSLKSGGEIFLGPNTLVHFTPVRAGDGTALFRLEVTRGTLKVKSREKLRLALREKNIEIEEGTRAEVSVQAIKPASEVSVEEGKALVLQSEDVREVTQEITSGQKIALIPERSLAAEPITFEPVSPLGNSIYFPTEPYQEIRFEWKGEPGAQIEISRHPLFEAGRIYEDSSPKRIPAGRYYWRLIHEDRKSPAASFTIMPPIQYQPLFPLPDRAVAATEKTELRWKEIPSAAGYVLEWSSDPEFGKFESQWVEKPSAQLQLEPGIYYWRIRARHSEWGDWQNSPAYRFKLRKRLEAPKTKGVKVLPKRSEIQWNWMEWFIPSAHAEEPEKIVLLFQWEAVEEAVGYQLEVSDRADFKNILFRRETTETLLEAQLPNRKKYYWRVSAKDIDGILSEPSSPELLTVGENNPKVKKVETKSPAPVQTVAEKPKREEPKSAPVVSSPAKKPRNPAAYSLLVGYGSIYQYARTLDDSFGLRTLGPAGNRWTGNLILPFGEHTLSLGADYQRFGFSPESTQISAFQHALRYEYYRGQILHLPTHPLAGNFYPVFGLDYERRPFFRRRANEVVDLHTTHKFAVVGGAGMWLPLSGFLGVNCRALLEAAPFGQFRGLGFWVSASPYFQIPSLGASLLLKVWGRADKIFLSPEGNSTLTFEMGGALLLGFSLSV